MPLLAPCPHRPPCPGCPRFGDRQPPAEAMATLEAIAQASSLPSPPFRQARDPLAYRHRARLAVRGRARSPKIGLFQADSHRIVDTPRCPVHHPLVNEVAAALKLAIRETGVAPYADRPHRGALRYVQTAVERSTDRAQVVLVGNGDTPEILGELPRALEEKLPGRIQGLFFNAQPERSNAIFGARTIKLSGEDALRERIGGVDVFFPPAAFGQNHLLLFDDVVARIHELVPGGASITEAYCGVGAIGLGLLERSARMRFNEQSPAGLEGLRLGLADRSADDRAKVGIFPGPAGRCLDAYRGADLVLVDPPRKGLDAELTRELAARPPKRLIYLACGVPALERDLEILLDRGKLRLRGIEAFDFFPFTGHVETLVWLDRNEEQFAPAP